MDVVSKKKQDLKVGHRRYIVRGSAREVKVTQWVVPFELKYISMHFIIGFDNLIAQLLRVEPI